MVFFLSSSVAARTRRIEWNGNWALGCDFLGNGLSSEPSKMKECRRLCKAASGCTHYVLTDDEDGICWMKSGKVSKLDAIYTGYDGMMCGVVETKDDRTAQAAERLGHPARRCRKWCLRSPESWLHQQQPRCSGQRSRTSAPQVQAGPVRPYLDHQLRPRVPGHHCHQLQPRRRPGSLRKEYLVSRVRVIVLVRKLLFFELTPATSL